MNKKLVQKDVPQEEAKTRTKKRYRMIVEVFVILALIMLICLALLKCTAIEEGPFVALMPDLDINAEDIGSRQNFIDAMQQEADSSYFNLQVNPQASFSASTGKGTFEIVNPPTNVYPISVNLYLDEDNTLLYESGSILPNMQIKGIELSRKLEVGTYTATAQVMIYDDKTHEKEGETQAKITLSVT